MNTKKLLSLWGLKWNPFSPELPADALLVTAKIDHFAWRVEQLVQEGGFALISGESGTGKSVALRILALRLAALRDVVVGVLERPQSRNADFYRELGDIFSVKLSPSNRWLRRRSEPRVAGAKHLSRGSDMRRATLALLPSRSQWPGRALPPEHLSPGTTGEDGRARPQSRRSTVFRALSAGPVRPSSGRRALRGNGRCDSRASTVRPTRPARRLDW